MTIVFIYYRVNISRAERVQDQTEWKKEHSNPTTKEKVDTMKSQIHVGD